MRKLILAVGLVLSLGANVGAQPLDSPQSGSTAPGPHVQNAMGGLAVPQAVNAWFRQNTGFSVEDFFGSSLWALTPRQKDELAVVFRDLTRQIADSGSPQVCLNEAWPRIWDVLNEEQRDRVALFIEVRDSLAGGDFKEGQERIARDFSDVAVRALSQLKGHLGQQDPLVLDIFESVLRRFQAARP